MIKKPTGCDIIQYEAYFATIYNPMQDASGTLGLAGWGKLLSDTNEDVKMKTERLIKELTKSN